MPQPPLPKVWSGVLCVEGTSKDWFLFTHEETCALFVPVKTMNLTELLRLLSVCPLPGVATAASVDTACCLGDAISQPQLTPSHILLVPPSLETLMPL